MSKWPLAECQRDTDLDQILRRGSIKYSWTLKREEVHEGAAVCIDCVWALLHVCETSVCGCLAIGQICYMCVIKPAQTHTQGCFLLVRVGDRHVWARGAAAISKVKCTTVKTYISRLVWLPGSTGNPDLLNIAATSCLQLFSLFYSPPLSLSISVPLFPFLILLSSAILYVNIYFTPHLRLFTVTLALLSSFHACWYSLLCQSSVAGERFPKVGMENYSVFASLKLSLYFFFSFKNQ